MDILFLLILALVVLSIAAYRWGANSSDGMNSSNGSDASNGLASTIPGTGHRYARGGQREHSGFRDHPESAAETEAN